jgi:aspartyl-tRNA(Asn)/glutamyl-tRNA(Gln) amidotransferase subunit A
VTVERAAGWLERSIPDVAAAVARGEVTAEALTEASLARIAALDARLGAFVTVAPERALEQARAVDRARERGESLGKLAGVPLGIKDVLCTADQPTTAGSRVLTGGGARGRRPERPWQPPYDATAIGLLRRAGAVLVGKCNMDEFAMGSSTENSAFGPTRNPWDPTRAPGGSSGGSAAAVATRMTPGALGSDTGGSVRQPASFCGVVGIKPSYGRVSRYGLIAFASSLDQVGPFATDVRGAACLLEAIAGHDPRDATSVRAEVPGYLEACGRDIRGLRVGVPEEYFGEGLEPEVADAVRAAIAALERLGARLRPVTLPHTRYAVAAYYIVATAECSSNLARFDGVRFGLRGGGERTLRGMVRATRAAFGAEVKRRIMLGTYVLSAGYYEAYYRRALRVRTLVRRDFDEAFREVDLIATPVSPTVAFPLGSRVADPLAMYLADVYTLPANLGGLSAVSVPCGLARASGMPVGLQLIAPAFEEARMIAAAYAYETVAPDRDARPAGAGAPP